MCKTKAEGITFYLDARTETPPCNCGAPAVFAAAWKMKKGPSYIMIPLCTSCVEGIAKMLVDAGIVKVEGR